MMKKFAAMALLFLGTLAVQSNAWAVDCQLTPEESRLAQLINNYRASNGLPAISISPSLTRVAQAHVNDLVLNRPNEGECNLHSWSSNGSWTPVCYTPDHRNMHLMHNKPSEITGGVYTSNGFEISYQGSTSASNALSTWQNSGAHSDVILQRGIWTNYPWQAMGVGLRDGYGHVWFGTQADPAGVCN